LSFSFLKQNPDTVFRHCPSV